MSIWLPGLLHVTQPQLSYPRLIVYVCGIAITETWCFTLPGTFSAKQGI